MAIFRLKQVTVSKWTLACGLQLYGRRRFVLRDFGNQHRNLRQKRMHSKLLRFNHWNMNSYISLLALKMFDYVRA